MSERKYVMGGSITDWWQLIGQECVYVPLGKEPIIKNMAFVQNLQFRIIARWMKNGEIRFAVPRNLKQETDEQDK